MLEALESIHFYKTYLETNLKTSKAQAAGKRKETNTTVTDYYDKNHFLSKAIAVNIAGE